MLKNYPEVYYSDSINELLEGVPSFRPKPTPPSMPKEDSSSLNGIFGFVGIICFVVGVIIAISGDEGSGYLIIGGLIAFVLSLIKKDVSNKLYKEREERFQNSPAMVQYREALKQWERDWSNTMTDERLKAYRKECYIQMPQFKFDSSVVFDSNNQNNDIKKGTTESFFLTKIIESRLFNVHDQMHLYFYYYSYYPDIVLSSLDGKILFDIEVDEPYSFSEHKPIHYINERGYSIDHDRNFAFIEHGFCVIRFSEEQIVRYPNDCVEYINAIIMSISNGEQDCPKPPSSLVQVKWDYDEANRMARNDYRKSYLHDYLPVDSGLLAKTKSNNEQLAYENDNSEYHPERGVDFDDFVGSKYLRDQLGLENVTFAPVLCQADDKHDDDFIGISYSGYAGTKLMHGYFYPAKTCTDSDVNRLFDKKELDNGIILYRPKASLSIDEVFIRVFYPHYEGKHTIIQWVSAIEDAELFTLSGERRKLPSR